MTLLRWLAHAGQGIERLIRGCCAFPCRNVRTYRSSWLSTLKAREWGRKPSGGIQVCREGFSFLFGFEAETVLAAHHVLSDVGGKRSVYGLPVLRLAVDGADGAQCAKERVPAFPEVGWQKPITFEVTAVDAELHLMS